jgi:hypothetical protein
MFKQGGFFDGSPRGYEDEISSSMEKNLQEKSLESKFAFSKLSRAANYLSYAAELFDKAGMSEEMEETLSLLKKLAVSMTQKVLP